MYKKIGFFLLIITLLGCSKDEKKVVVGSKPHTEQYILGEIISQTIENNTDIKVEKKFGIGGGTSNIHPAMEKGDIDIYPEYDSTGWSFVLKNPPLQDGKDLLSELRKQYSYKYKIKWLNYYGFNNTYALAMKKDLAENLGINSYSDLAKKSQDLKFGAEYDFYEREDGFKNLEKNYGMDFSNKKELDIGLKYLSIGENQVDVINVFSTDALLKKYNLKVLNDDKNLFPPYYAATVIREETLKKYPELEPALKKLDNNINNNEMIEMNYLVEIENKDPKDVAHEFLKNKGIIK
ncbi:MAG: glycine betaine ABC transporter substrate-binding protein [Cetobacterium sp.]